MCQSHCNCHRDSGRKGELFYYHIQAFKHSCYQVQSESVCFGARAAGIKRSAGRCPRYCIVAANISQSYNVILLLSKCSLFWTLRCASRMSKPKLNVYSFWSRSKAFSWIDRAGVWSFTSVFSVMKSIISEHSPVVDTADHLGMTVLWMWDHLPQTPFIIQGVIWSCRSSCPTSAVHFILINNVRRWRLESSAF